MINRLIILMTILTMALSAEITSLASSYQNGIANAKKYNKTLMVMFTDTNCKQCNYMQSSIYEDKEIADYINKNFVYLELDKDGNHGLDIVIAPTIYFINSQGKVIGKIIGARNPELFLKELKKY
ncbi:MAG: thioredoxin family protein [Sulfurovum sp.]|nr:thioredoxin family protein [Sulfurovaceae bacterium]